MNKNYIGIILNSGQALTAEVNESVNEVNEFIMNNQDKTYFKFGQVLVRKDELVAIIPVYPKQSQQPQPNRNKNNDVSINKDNIVDFNDYKH
jgi:hypothetical protein